MGAEEELRLRGGLGVGEVGRGVPGGSGGSEEAMDEIKKFFFFLKKNDLDGAACHFFENTYEKKNTVSDVKHV